MDPRSGPPRFDQRLRLSLIIIAMGVPGPGRLAASERVERRLVAMGTVLRVRVAGADRPAALAASEAAVGEIERVDRLLSTWKEGGPLGRLNAAAPGEAVAVGPEVRTLLADAFAWARRTGRAFDPTVLPLVKAWDLRGQGRIPGSEELARAAAATGPQRFRLDPAAEAAARLDKDAGIDEGAWGKGYALDLAAAAARDAGATESVLDLGGQVLVRGRWTVVIADPRDRQRPAATVFVESASVSTSGNSERGRVVGGRRIGHLLDPRTGRPARDFGSATVVASSALVADVLSTAFFVLGPDRGLELSESLRRQGFPNEALFLIAGGGPLRAAASPHLSFHLEEKRP